MGWVDYPKKADEKICEAYKAGKKEVVFQLKVGNRKNDYTLDFVRVVQMSKDTDKTRPVRAPYDLLKKFNAEAKESGPKEYAGDDVSQDESPKKKKDKVEPVKVDNTDKKKVEEAINKEYKSISA